jgi:arginase
MDKPIGLLWIDAHGDMNTPASTPSGNVHGMPLAALLGPEPAELSSIGGFSPTVSPGHTALVGVRNLDVDRLGMAAVATEALQAVGRDVAGIHVSFDLDVCDPSVAPGVGTPVKGGLNYREAHLLMEIIAESEQLMALDLVEVNPTLDLRNTTAELAVELALSALGQKIL